VAADVPETHTNQSAHQWSADHPCPAISKKRHHLSVESEWNDRLTPGSWVTLRSGERHKTQSHNGRVGHEKLYSISYERFNGTMTAELEEVQAIQRLQTSGSRYYGGIGLEGDSALISRISQA
jgi:hypothetical protein